jgi:hypothetical protein
MLYSVSSECSNRQENAARAAATKSRILAGSFLPGDDSTPLATSTA